MTGRYCRNSFSKTYILVIPCQDNNNTHKIFKYTSIYCRIISINRIGIKMTKENVKQNNSCKEF